MTARVYLICGLTFVARLLLAAPGVAHWAPSIGAGLKRAAAEHKLVMVFVGATWEPNSQQFLNGTMGQPQVLDMLNKDFVYTKVDGDRERSVRNHYGVYSYPTFIFLMPSGEEIWRVSRSRDARALQETLRFTVFLERETERIRERLAKSPSDPWALEQQAALYAKEERIDLAEVWITRAAKADPSNLGGRLAAAYDALGDYYQLQGLDAQRSDGSRGTALLEKAIQKFEHGRSTAKTGGDIYYSNISLASCNLSLSRFEKVKTYTDSILQSNLVTEGDKRGAQGLQQRADQGLANRARTRHGPAGR